MDLPERPRILENNPDLLAKLEPGTSTGDVQAYIGNDVQVPSHSQVNVERLSRTEIEQDMLANTPNRADPLTGDCFFDDARILRAADGRPEDPSLDDGRVRRQILPQPPADGLNLRQFGQWFYFPLLRRRK
jgi:hypothetical protein